MRKLALLVGISALLVPVGAAAQQPSVHTDVSQLALAQWTVTEDGERVVYFAAGFNRARGTDWPSIGYAGRAECKKVVHGHHTRYVCRGRARPVELAPGDFLVDPALQSAHLKVTAYGFTNEVSWTAKGTEPPQPYFHQHAGTDVGAQVMTASARRATATGTIFGNELEEARFGYMSEGVMFDVYPNAPAPRAGEVTFRDGVMHFRHSFRA